MSLVFKPRIIELILKQICNKHKLSFNVFANGWIFEISNKHKTIFTWGYNFPINNTTSSKICDDKAGLAQILLHHNIPCFIHEYFIRDNCTDKQLLTCFKKYKRNVVVKPNFGTTGFDTEHINDNESFLKHCHLILNKHGTLAISPFYDYCDEFRIVLYKQKPHIVYKKQRAPHNWKHNIGNGNKIIPIHDFNKHTNIINLAIRATELIDINFCSVDIAIVNNKPLIVEINSGVMLEQYAKGSTAQKKQAYKLYELAILELFN